MNKIINWFKIWWMSWIQLTYTRAQIYAQLDEMLYGNSFIRKHWWGYSHVPFKDGMEVLSSEIKKGNPINTIYDYGR